VLLVEAGEDHALLLSNAASETATVIEVRAADGVGVLYRITWALAECGLDVRSAKVATIARSDPDSKNSFCIGTKYMTARARKRPA
jgi:UTP:GlnB (protein PII) uridylyltransferase